MQITFSDGEAGFREARALELIARDAIERDPIDATEIQVIDMLQAAAQRHLERPEFASLLAAADASNGNGRTHLAREGLRWRLFGPSRREQLLSAQRSAALERAERAEQSAFEALAEMARVARERDEARARITELEQALAAERGGR